jgi:hypothetical protein
MRWDFVKLNLPGNLAYDPPNPRVMKWDLLIENIAEDVIVFVDDLRASGHTIKREPGLLAGRSFLVASTASGPWAGCLSMTYLIITPYLKGYTSRWRHIIQEVTNLVGRWPQSNGRRTS